MPIEAQPRKNQNQKTKYRDYSLSVPIDGETYAQLFDQELIVDSAEKASSKANKGKGVHN